MDEEAHLNTLAPHNIVAVFFDVSQATSALAVLAAEGIDEREISMLARDPVGAGSGRRSAGKALFVRSTRVRTLMRKVLVGGLVGALVGVIVGAVAFVHADSGADLSGIWIAISAGLASGVLAGGLLALFDIAWDERYREMVRDGRVVVGVHTLDADRAARAYAALQQLQPLHLAHFDDHGRSIHEAHAP